MGKEGYISFLLAAGVEVIFMYGPDYFPAMPAWIWAFFFWFGIFLIAVGITCLVVSLDTRKKIAYLYTIIPLHEAAKEAHAEGIEKRPGKTGSDLDRPLKWFATALAANPDYPINILGNRPHSHKPVVLPPKEINRLHFVVNEHEACLVDESGEVKYERLYILRKDLRIYLNNNRATQKT